MIFKQRKGALVLIVAMVGILVLAFFVSKQSNETSRRIDERQEILSARERADEEEAAKQRITFFLVKENRLCDTVEDTSRRIDPDRDPIRASLEEMLRGADSGDRKDHLTSVIPRTTLLNFKIVDGVARLHFSKSIQDLRDECQIRGVKAQINETLKQFEGIHSVIITVEGVDQSDVLKLDVGEDDD